VIQATPHAATHRAATPSAEAISGRSAGAPGLDRWLRALCRLPPPAAEHGLALAALVMGLRDARLRRQAFAWAARHASSRRARLGMALALLRNRGRLRALAALPAIGSVAYARRRLDARGGAYLGDPAARSGTILLTFHLGPMFSGLPIRLPDGEITVAGDTDQAAWPRPRADWLPLIETRRRFVPIGGEGSLQGILRLRRLLLDGATLMLAADADAGAEAFRLRVGGAEVVIRSLWWTLRRQTQARVVPWLSHCAGSRLVIELGPALPAPDPDPARDLDACRAALRPLLERYVARFPEQCVGLAFSERRQQD
jgi:hypothetical protein